MKKLIPALAVVLGLTTAASAQNEAQPAAAKLPVKIGLVDMARVFKEYDKFNALREDLKSEMKADMDAAQALAAKAKSLQEELKLLNRGSPDFIKKEAELARVHSDFETKRKLINSKNMREEARIFEQVYLEARDAVKLYAEYYKYTLIIRFNSAPIDAENPQSLANSLNKLIVYHQPQNDITGAVIDYLNRQWERNSASAKKQQPIRQTGGNSTRPQVQPGSRTQGPRRN